MEEARHTAFKLHQAESNVGEPMAGGGDLRATRCATET